MLTEKIHAVLTGDLVQSSKLSDSRLQHVRRRLVNAVDEVKCWQKKLVSGSPDFFRGDAWQMLILEPELAMRAALFLRTSLLAEDLVDTRIAIGLGTVDKIQKRISLSSGEAFTLSGRALDGLKRNSRMSITLPETAKELRDWMPVLARFTDLLIGHWTQRQAEIVKLALAPGNPTHSVIAERLDPPVSKQTVTKALAGADWVGIASFLAEFEKTDWRRVCSESVP